MKNFKKLLVIPATAAIVLSPNLNGFAKDKVKTFEEGRKTNQEKNLIAQVGEQDQEKDTLKISVTGTRTPRETKNVPASVNVIGKDQIGSRGITDLKSLFKYDAGVSIKSNENGSASAPNNYGQDAVNIRGMESNRVLMQRDNINLPQKYEALGYELGRANYVDLNTLSSVEILKGPGSSLYGSDAMGGVINYRSLYPEDLLKPDQEFSVEFPVNYDGSNQSKSASMRAAFRDDNSGFEGVLVTTRMAAEEEKVKADDKYINDQDITKNSIYTNVVKNIDDYSRFNFIFENVDNETKSTQKKDAFLSSSHTSAKEDIDVKRWMSSLGYEYDNPNSDNLFSYAKANIYVQDADYSDDSVVSYKSSMGRFGFSPAKTYDNDYGLVDESKGFNLQLRSDLETNNLEHKLTYGLDYSTTFNSRSRKKTTISQGSSTVSSVNDSPDSDTEKYGIYIQDEIKFKNNDQLELIAGLRFDQYNLDSTSTDEYAATMAARGKREDPVDKDESTLNPSLALIYKLSPELSAYGKYSTAFRAPTYAEVNSAFGNVFHGYYVINNPELKAEESDNYEIGVKGSYPKFDFSLISFFNKYENYIDGYSSVDSSVNDGSDCISITGRKCLVFQYQNKREAEIWGIEMNSEYNFNGQEEGFSLISSLAYAHGEDTSSSKTKPLLEVNPFKAILGVKYTSKDSKWISEILNTYVGTADTPSEYSNNPHESYILVDYLNTYNLNNRFSIDLGVYNLFDTRYFDYSTVRTKDASDDDINRFSEASRHVKAGFKFIF